MRSVLERAIRAHRDCDVVSPASIAQLMTGDIPSPDVIVLGLAGGEDVTLVPALFARWPLAHVVTVTDTGEDANLYELTPRLRNLGQLSSAAIVETLVDAVHRRRAPEQDHGIS
jgi:DNA-binding NarL/FixJ family response regulator